MEIDIGYVAPILTAILFVGFVGAAAFVVIEIVKWRQRK